MAISKRDVRYINKLIKFSKDFEYNKNEYLVISLLVNKNKLCYGVNNYKKKLIRSINSKKTNYQYSTLHSEIDAIKRWIWDESPLTIYVICLTRIGNFCTSSKPCASCLHIIKQFKIKRIVYINNINNELLIKEEIINYEN